MRIDLHCHSKHSKRASLWLMQKLGCPESFTHPTELYSLLRQQGMDGATITDHNAIDGCLEIAHLPNAFISCEYTAYFPEDRCKIHVLVHDISERQHEELMRARESIFDLTAYAHENGLHYTCAHPLYSVNDRLTVTHIERLLLLFKSFELNGDVNPEMNEALRRLLRALTPESIESLANKHGIAPLHDSPWLKNIIGGSDDHSSLRLGIMHTNVENAQTLAEFWNGVQQGQARVEGEHATPQSYARGIYGIVYQFFKYRFELERYRNKDILLQFLDRMLQTRPENPEPFWGRVSQTISRMRRPRPTPAANASLIELVRFEAEKLIRCDKQLMALIEQGAARGRNLDEKWFECFNQVSNNMLVHLGRLVLDRVLHARLLDLIQTLGSAAALYLMIAPYIVSFSIRASQQIMCNNLERMLSPAPPPANRVRLAHFTDTLHEVNGVARTLRQQLAAAMALGKDYTIITVAPERQDYQRGVHYFHAIGAYDLPEYPEIKLLYPPFLQMLNHCHKEQFTHIHVATPGLVGLAGLAIARILQLPISGTYHTAIPEYAKALTEDANIEDLLWKYMIWFYDQMDFVYAPSQATANDLISRGISGDKIRLYPRGVDIERFHPGKRNPQALHACGIPQDTTIMLYVGRVSKEKGLHVLLQAFRDVSKEDSSLTLVIVGDGPYRKEMEEESRGLPVVFTGYAEDDTLPALYASSDFLVFPSATDTFGNVVLEAHASAIPVIVTNVGGPKENTIHGETGLIVEANNPGSLAEAIQAMASEPGLRKRMGAAGRQEVARRGFTKQFEKLYEMYLSAPAHEPNDISKTASASNMSRDEIGAAIVSSVFSLDKIA